MGKQNNENLKNLKFVDFLEQIDLEINNSITKNDFENVIEKLQNYKINVQADNQIFKQSIIDAIDQLIEDINKLY